MGKITKHCVFLLAFMVFVSSFYNSVAQKTPCADWLPYKDEKCFKVIDDTLRTYDEAEKACAKLEGSPTLAIVHSKEEQDLLVNYLFRTLKKVDNVWIGAKFSSNTFHWIDNSSLTFTNWDSKAPHNKSNYCVQVLAEEVTLGKWIDGPCERKNAVVCQKSQTWSLVRLQETFLEARKQLTDALAENKAEANKKINDQKVEIEEANKKIKDQKVEIEEANKKIADLKQNFIPIGFIYTQLPNEKNPTTIWPWMTWSDVTSTYAGVFFRAEGGGSGQFGQTQVENDHRVIRMESELRDISKLFSNVTIDVNTDGQSTKTSDWIWTGDSAKETYHTIYLRFVTTTGEVRPRNMAVRIWKRTG